MNLLSKIETGRKPKPRRTLVYGVHGIGKSTFAASADKPVFIQTEDGLSEIDCARFPLAQSFDEVIEALKELYTTENQFKTICVDSLDWLEKLIFEVVCKEKGVDSIEDIGYAKGYTFALSHWRKFLNCLDKLRNDKGYSVVLIAHAKIARFENPDTDPYDRYEPSLHKHSSAMIQEWCDEVLFAVYKVHTKKTDEGFNKKRTKGIGTGERLVKTTERPSHIAKNRLGLPDELPLDYQVYSKYFRQPQLQETSK